MEGVWGGVLQIPQGRGHYRYRRGGAVQIPQGRRSLQIPQGGFSHTPQGGAPYRYRREGVRFRVVNATTPSRPFDDWGRQVAVRLERGHDR